MKRSHRVIVRACSCLAGRTGALIVGLAMVWVVLLANPLQGQNNTYPWPQSGNVGIGTNSPTTLFNVNAGVTRFSNAGVNSSRVDIYGGVDGGQTSGIYLYNTAGVLNTYLSDGTFSFINAHGGNVGIGTTTPGTYKLAVEGTIGARDVIVTNTPWSDYVFRPGYRLRPLREVGAYIRANHHLPDIPSEREVKEKGVSVGEMQSKLLAKVEELTLHMIRAEERNNRLERQNQELRDRLARLEKGAATSAPATAAK